MRNQYDKDTDTLGQMLVDLKLHRTNMLRGQFLTVDEKGVISNSLEIANARYILRNVERLVRSILARHKDDVYEEGAQRPARPKYYKGESKPNINPPAKSAIIPLQFNALMDGISGMVIGQVFKVDNTRLPKGYQGDDIAFIVFSEGQNITAGQDWTTEFSGKLVSLDLRKEIDEDELILTPGGYDNQTNPEQDLPETEVTKTTEGELDNINKVEEESGEVSNEEIDTDAPAEGSEEIKSLVDEFKKVAYWVKYGRANVTEAFTRNIDASNQLQKYRRIQKEYYDEVEEYKRLDRLAREAVENGEVASYEDYATAYDQFGFGGDKPQFSLDRQQDILDKAKDYWVENGYVGYGRAKDALDKINSVDDNIREEALKQYRALSYPTNLKIGNTSFEITEAAIYDYDDLQDLNIDLTDLDYQRWDDDL